MNQQPIDDMKVDAENLYREESITDLRVASIRRLIPIKTDGSDDPSRKTVYTGSAQIMSQMGPLPVSTEIEADSLEEALEKFPEAIRGAIERMVDEAKEMQRQESSRIVVPKTGPPGLTGGTPPGGTPGAPGGGNIILGS